MVGNETTQIWTILIFREEPLLIFLQRKDSSKIHKLSTKPVPGYDVACATCTIFYLACCSTGKLLAFQRFSHVLHVRDGRATHCHRRSSPEIHRSNDDLKCSIGITRTLRCLSCWRNTPKFYNTLFLGSSPGIGITTPRGRQMKQGREARGVLISHGSSFGAYDCWY